MTRRPDSADSDVIIQLVAEIRMIGDREQIEAIPPRLTGQPRRINCPADINAIPGAQPTAEQHTPI
jgi:hypothetical protein